MGEWTTCAPCGRPGLARRPAGGRRGAGAGAGAGDGDAGGGAGAGAGAPRRRRRGGLAVDLQPEPGALDLEAGEAALVDQLDQLFDLLESQHSLALLPAGWRAPRNAETRSQ